MALVYAHATKYPNQVEHTYSFVQVLAASVDGHVHHECDGWCWVLQWHAEGGELPAGGAVGVVVDFYDSGCGHVGGCVDVIVLECASFLEIEVRFGL